MVVVNNFYFLKDAGEAQVSAVTKNMTGENLTVQVDGDGSGFSLKLSGCSDMASESYYDLTGISNDLENVKTITENGIYSFNIDGISKIEANLSAINSGSVTVFGKITKKI